MFQSRDVICFIVGGVSFEEEFHIYRLNKELQGIIYNFRLNSINAAILGQARIIIGGSSVLNSRSFLAEVLRSSEKPANAETV